MPRGPGSVPQGVSPVAPVSPPRISSSASSSSAMAFEAAPRRFVCISEGGAIMRAGPEMSSEKTGVLQEFEEIDGLSEVELPNGVLRIECDRGWVSMCAGDGTPILEEIRAHAVSPPHIRRMSADLGGAIAHTLSPGTRGVRAIAKDPGQRLDQLKRFGTERELLLRHSLVRLQKTQRLRLPRGHQIALLDSAQLAQIDCQDVMRCLRTGDGLDLAEILLPPAAEPEPEGEAEAEASPAPAEPAFVLYGSQLVTAAYETFVLSYNRLQPEGYDAGKLEVRVVEAELLQGAGSITAGQLSHVTMAVGRMTARTTAKAARESSCVVSDGCRMLELQMYVGVKDPQGNPAVRSLGTVNVPLSAVFEDRQAHAWYDLSVSNGYKTRQTARVRLDMTFQSGAMGLRIEVLERIQAAFEISEVQHEEIVENLELPDARDAGATNDGMSVEMMAKLQLRMQHRLAVPEGVCIGTCPHYRLLLLQNKRPRDFGSDSVFDQWQERQVSVVVNALLALVRRMDRTEREGMVELNESSMLPDVERSLRQRFNAVIEISHDYKTSAGFPEEEYTACLDALYDYSMDVYSRHDHSYDLAPLQLPEVVDSPLSEESPSPRERGHVEEVPASVWDSFRYPLNTAIYETLCAASFDHDAVGRHDELKDDIVGAMERTRAHLGVTNEQQHLCLARQHFDEHVAAEQESVRDTMRNRAALESERKEMLTSLQDHIILSTLQDQNLPSFDGSGLTSPATSEAAEEETKRLRAEVVTPIMEYFSALVEDYHSCDIDMMPRALRVYVALRHPEEPQKVIRELMTLTVVKMYERLSKDCARPISAEGLGRVVRKVLEAIDVEIDKYESVWEEFIPGSTVLFIRAMGSRVRQDYETGDCPGAIDHHVVRAIALLQQLENKMLASKALDPASRILAHADARHGGASPYSKLVWAWIDNQGQQFQNTVTAFVEHETWEAETIVIDAAHDGGGTPLSRSASSTMRKGHALTSFSIDGLFELFQGAMESFFEFAIASDDMFLCLVEHIVSACLYYANGVVESCGDLLDIVPPSPPVQVCAKQVRKVSVTPEREGPPLPSNSSICVRMNNLHDGLQRFILFFTSQKGRWVEFAALGYSQPLSMRRLDYLVNSVRRSFGDSINQLIDYLGCKVVYSDLRDILLDGLYLPAVQDCRIDDALPLLSARLRSLDALLAEPVVRDMHDAVYRNFAGCFQRVLIDGGANRIFTVEDKQIFDEDFCAIKAEVHRIESLMDVDAMERLFTLLSMTTANLIDFHAKADVQSTVEGDHVYRSDTILRIISHRDDRKAKDFVKKAVKEALRAGAAGGGASPGRGHTATDLAALYGSGSATFDQLKRRFG